LAAAAQFLFAASASAQSAKLIEPKPILEGDKVVTLFPPGHPALKLLDGYDQPEKFNFSKGANPHVLNITNIHNPSIELQLPPPAKANGTAIVVAAGGGNTTLWVGPEGAEVGKWLNGLGVAAFNERYRLKPYDSAGDALADTQRSVRMVRAHAKEWGVDPKKIGVMGFSAGGEQAARIALNFDDGKPDVADPIDRESCRPDFVVLVYAGWRDLDLSHVPKNAPPAFCVCAGVDDAFHAKETVEFYNAYFNAKIPAELHIYAHGGHGGGIGSRGGIPFGTWPLRFTEWATDIGMLPKREAGAAK
jgi:endo-1,4-beta-xylanase